MLFSCNGNAILITAHIIYVKGIRNTCVNDMNRSILLFFKDLSMSFITVVTTVDIQQYYIKFFHPSNLLHFIAGHIETSQLTKEDCLYSTWSSLGCSHITLVEFKKNKPRQAEYMGICVIIHKFKFIFQIATLFLTWQFHLPAAVHNNEKGVYFIQMDT